MQLVFAWVAVILVFVAPFPTTVWLLSLSPLPAEKVLIWILAGGLGIGVLTWLMMWEGMLGIPFQVVSILLPYLIVYAVGTILWWRRRAPKMISVPEDRPSPSPIRI